MIIVSNIITTTIIAMLITRLISSSTDIFAERKLLDISVVVIVHWMELMRNIKLVVREKKLKTVSREKYVVKYEPG